MKLDRANHNKQIAKQKRAEILQKKRLGSSKSAPKIIGVVALSPLVDVEALKSSLLNHPDVKADGLPGAHPHVHSIESSIDKKKHRFTFYIAPRDPMAVLDIASVADILLLVMTPGQNSEETGEDAVGYNFTKILKSQGLASFICLHQGIEGDAAKQLAAKKLITRYFHTAFEGEPKVLPCSSQQDWTQILRWSSNLNLREPTLRQDRAYLLGETAQFQANVDNQALGTLSITGYLRGSRNLSANQLIHITGFDDFSQSQILSWPADGHSSKASKGDMEMSTDDGPATPALLQVADENRQSLQALGAVDPLAHEQSIITEEEIRAAQMENAQNKNQNDGSGLSDYQKVWNDILSSDDENEDEEPALVDGGVMDSKADTDMVSEATTNVASSILEKKKLERDEIDFPDEVDTPMEGNARDRFQRYRGLKSFVDSPWDKNESLPLSYSQIFKFEDFERMQRYVTSEEQNAGPAEPNVNNRITITLINVPTESARQMCTSARPITLWGLFEHERKVSVLNFCLKRNSDYEAPVKGKEEMLFQVGFRRFHARPIYTVNTPQKDKALVERFFQQGRFSVASVFANIQFSATPVLMFLPSRNSSLPNSTLTKTQSSTFTESSLTASANCLSSMVSTARAPASPPPMSETEGAQLVAFGSYMGCNPDKILAKRIILTGYPVGVNKRAAVVRKMFYNPDDIRWFKPVELRTKMGLMGHIKEPRGTKGYMKCMFDGFIKNHDTVVDVYALHSTLFRPYIVSP